MVRGDKVKECVVGKNMLPYMQNKLMVVIRRDPRNNILPEVIESVFGVGTAYHQCDAPTGSRCQLGGGKFL